MCVLRCLLIAVCVLGVTLCVAQQPNLEPDRPGDKPVPTVTFDFSLPGTSPSHYAISVESTGQAAYRSDDVGQQGVKDSEAGEPFTQKFVISDPTRTRIFDLAKQANYFKGKFDSGRRNIANTGAKTLVYGEGPADSLGHSTNGVRNQTTFNYSENLAVQQLTDIFQAISATLEIGRRLNHLQRYDRLGLDEELKNAEQLAQEKRLGEVQAIAPALQKIADDPSVMHLARQRALHLLALAQRH